jgi:LysM repeat protein
MLKNLFLFFLVYNVNLFAQTKNTPEDYIRIYGEDAIKEMNRTGIPASIKMAQGMLESSYGNSMLAKQANNHFGIKCHAGWTGKTFHKDDDEKNECFRVYSNPIQSFLDHSDFLINRPRYAFLFELDIYDYKAWANGLKKAGYATNPKYPELIINMIEKYNLQELDKKYTPLNAVEKEKEITKRKAITRNHKNDDDDEVKVGYNLDIQLSENYVKYIIVKNNDTYVSIAQNYNISENRLLKYNERDNKSSINVGEKLYLQPKRSWAKTKFHTVQNGETIYSISQKYGIKTKSIINRNRLESETIKPGQVLKLRGFKVKIKQ